MSNVKIIGIHHVTAMTSSGKKIYDFFTDILGMRLVKKTVNQDDITAYHLFFADDMGSPGTDVTFFEFKNSTKKEKGTNLIDEIGLRVPTDEALLYYQKRFLHYQIKHEEINEVFGKKILKFYDFDQQNYFLISDETNQGVASGTPWNHGPVPNEYAITGLGPVTIAVNHLNKFDDILRNIMTMRFVKAEDGLFLYEMGQGGNGASIFVKEDLTQPARLGFGGVHHVAFRVDKREDLFNWIKHLELNHKQHSGHIDRYYFESLYTRLYPGVLFEFATDEPGFIDHEERYETLGETLALPPKFIPFREKISKLVDPLDTSNTNRIRPKEYH